MGKRSNFEKKHRDKYYTIDPKASLSLSQLLGVQKIKYAEPCVGDGSLVDLLGDNFECVWASDIEPDGRYSDDMSMGAEDITKEQMDAVEAEYIITNPPFTRNILLPIIDHFVYDLKIDTAFLLPSNIIHNKYFCEYVTDAAFIKSMGRLYFEENMIRGKDDYVWILWKPNNFKVNLGPVYLPYNHNYTPRHL